MVHEDKVRQALVALVALGRADWLYADWYLYRAGTLLPTLYSRQEYLRDKGSHARLSEVQGDIRRVAEQRRWNQVASLAERAEQLVTSLKRSASLLSLGDAIYGARSIGEYRPALTLGGLGAASERDILRARAELVSSLTVLERGDAENEAFYRQRRLELENWQAEIERESTEKVNPEAIGSELQQAINRGHFSRVRELSEALLRVPGAGPSSRFRAPLPNAQARSKLSEPFPVEGIERAAEFGLFPETLSEEPSPNAYLSCGCGGEESRGWQPQQTKGTACPSGSVCPPVVGDGLRDVLDFFLKQPCVSSGGFRYLPWFGEETVLVETFCEQEETSGPLLEALELPKRRGLSRLELEHALRCHGPHVCEAIGLNPLEHALTCIPYDVYARLAPQYGWGEAEQWTHFDGYQITRNSRLSAIVGGHSRFGGRDDICSLGRDYAPDHIMARFAVVRRGRFVVRESQPNTTQ